MGRLGGEPKTVGDYYRLETDQGRRYSIFRDAPATDSGRWRLHGMLG
jgi:protein ImuB